MSDPYSPYAPPAPTKYEPPKYDQSGVKHEAPAASSYEPPKYDGPNPSMYDQSVPMKFEPSSAYSSDPYAVPAPAPPSSSASGSSIPPPAASSSSAVPPPSSSSVPSSVPSSTPPAGAPPSGAEDASKPLVAHYEGSLQFGRPPPGHQNDPTMGHIYHGRRAPGPGPAVPPNNQVTLRGEHKVFIGGLNRATTTQQLRDYFSQFGVLTDAAVIYQRSSNESRGFGFVTYQTIEGKEACLRAPRLELDGRILECKNALPADECAQNTSVVESTRGFENKIFVGGVAQTVSQDKVREYFSRYGTVTDCILMNPKEGSLNNHRGFGFIKFAEKNAFQMVLDKHQEHVIDGKWVEVKPAVSKDAPDAFYQSMNSKPPKREGFDDIAPPPHHHHQSSYDHRGGYNSNQNLNNHYNNNSSYGSKPYNSYSSYPPSHAPSSHHHHQQHQPKSDEYWWDSVPQNSYSTSPPPAAPPAQGGYHQSHPPAPTDVYSSYAAQPSHHYQGSSYYQPPPPAAHDPYAAPPAQGGAPDFYSSYSHGVPQPSADPYHQSRERERDRPAQHYQQPPSYKPSSQSRY